MDSDKRDGVAGYQLVYYSSNYAELVFRAAIDVFMRPLPSPPPSTAWTKMSPHLTSILETRKKIIYDPDWTAVFNPEADLYPYFHDNDNDTDENEEYDYDDGLYY